MKGQAEVGGGKSADNVTECTEISFAEATDIGMQPRHVEGADQAHTRAATLEPHPVIESINGKGASSIDA